MTTIPLSVLAWEGPLARAYLARMRRAGLRPECCVLAVNASPVDRKRNWSRYFPKRLSVAHYRRRQDISQNFWPRMLPKRFPEVFRRLTDVLCHAFDIDPDFFAELSGSFAYERYAARVEPVLVRDLDDPALISTLAGTASSAILYTGGGLLSAPHFALPGKRFIHVHPGRLPQVRGADGLLWSTIVNGHPSASIFYMAPGIDTGDIIDSTDFDPCAFPIRADRRPDDVMLYRYLFSVYDPLLRSDLLLRTLAGSGDLASLEASAQTPSDGTTFHFMHPNLRRAALLKIFPPAIGDD